MELLLKIKLQEKALKEIILQPIDTLFKMLYTEIVAWGEWDLSKGRKMKSTEWTAGEFLLSYFYL